MKKDLHPTYVMSRVICACGNEFTTRSTTPEIKLEICSACHPFFTGKQKFLDTEGRIDKFKKKFAKTEGKMVKRKPKKSKVGKTVATRKKVLSTRPVKGDEKTAKSKKPAKKS
jgi:large subunit ribosomal protein L31